MFSENKIWIGKSGDESVYIYPSMANRHGLIAGATGTGKTITLKVMAESFSDAGVPVFLADVKGDLAGMCCQGRDSEDMQNRIAKFRLAEKGFWYTAYPTTFWDVYQTQDGKYTAKGLPLRTTVSEMGPLLMARILGLNDTQTDLLTVIFKIADDQELLLIDTKDLKAMLNYAAENADDLAMSYGNIPKASVNVIIRSIVALESDGGEKFFGEPALNISDWFNNFGSSKGPMHILDCQELINHPNMYATFMLWLVSELFETLPEAGDLERPRMVFFFDEAHMLFKDASKVLLAKIEQLVKLIRSKGVGIYFITQNPKDIPDGVLAQLGNKVQHALHAYTPAEQKGAKAAAESFRANPEFDTYSTLLELGIGEALVSVLDEKGIPTVVQRTKILPPQSLMGPIDDMTRNQQITGSMLYNRYNDYFDRDSAYEFLLRQKQGSAENFVAQASDENSRNSVETTQSGTLQQTETQTAAQPAALSEKEQKRLQKEEEKARKAAEKEEAAAAKATKKSSSSKTSSSGAYQVKKAAKSVATTTGGTVGRELGKQLGNSLGGSFGKTLGGNVGASLGRSIMGTFFRS